MSIEQTLARLEESVADGRLGDLASRLGLEIVLLFGSAVTSPTPGDIDIGVGFHGGADRDFLGVVDALAEEFPGDHLDVADLDRAGPVLQHRAMFGSRVLWATSSRAVAEREIRAFMAYEDTRWLRELQTKALRG